MAGQADLDEFDRIFVGLPSPTMSRSLPGGHPCQGLYWTPRKEPHPRIAVIATHYSVDFSEHYIAPYLTRHGLGFLGWNTRFRGADDLFTLEDALLDINVGVRWLREQAGAQTVVILGNSGGGSLMAAYQAEATDPQIAGNAPGRMADLLSALVPGDHFITLAAHTGRPEVLTNWIDPSVVDETDPFSTEVSLDAFEPANGPPYSTEFIARYRAAQQSRNQRITDWAKSQLQRLSAAGAADRVFPLYRAWADLRFMDPGIDPSDRPARRCYLGDPAVVNRSMPAIARSSTLRGWLSMWSLECSKCRSEPHLKRIRVPSMVIQATRDVGVFPSDANALCTAIGSADKQLVYAPGGHFFEDSSSEREHVAMLMANWIGARS